MASSISGMSCRRGCAESYGHGPVAVDVVQFDNRKESTGASKERGTGSGGKEGVTLQRRK